MPVPFSVISSAAEFQAVFTPPRADAAASPPPPSDAFLFCYEVGADGVAAESLQALRDAVDASAGTHGTRLALHFWNCSSDCFAAAKAQLEKKKGEPLLLVVYHGAIADTIRGKSLRAMIAEDVPRVCERLAAFQRSNKPVQVVPPATSSGGRPAEGERMESAAEPRTLRVDVAKIMNLGQDLLRRGEPAYAEKAFVKALDALQAVEPEVRASNSADSEGVVDFEGSVAMALAWAGLSQIVQGKALQDNPHLRRLTGEERYAHFCAEPLTDACRVATTQQLMRAAPHRWTGDTCSQKKLHEALTTDPMDHKSRAMLVITLFLAGDVERALTEAIKLNSFQQDFGRVALRRIVAFLGPGHPLVQQLGPLTPSTA